MIFLGIIFTVLQLLDLISTNMAIKAGCTESNPLLKEALESGFPVYMAFIKVGLGIFLIVLLSIGNVMLNWVVLFLDIFMLIVVFNNMVRIPIQKKYNKTFFLESANLIKFWQVWDVREWIHTIQHVKVKKEVVKNKWNEKVLHMREWIGANQQQVKTKKEIFKSKWNEKVLYMRELMSTIKSQKKKEKIS